MLGLVKDVEDDFFFFFLVASVTLDVVCLNLSLAGLSDCFGCDIFVSSLFLSVSSFSSVRTATKNKRKIQFEPGVMKRPTALLFMVKLHFVTYYRTPRFIPSSKVSCCYIYLFVATCNILVSSTTTPMLFCDIHLPCNTSTDVKNVYGTNVVDLAFVK